VIRCERFKPLSKMSFDCATFGTRFNIPVLARLFVPIFPESSFSAKLCFLPSLSSSSSRLPLATTKERQLLPEQREQQQHRFFFLRCCCCCSKTRATEERAPTKEKDEEEREDATTTVPNRRGGEMGFRVVVAALENNNISKQQSRHTTKFGFCFCVREKKAAKMKTLNLKFQRFFFCFETSSPFQKKDTRERETPRTRAQNSHHGNYRRRRRRFRVEERFQFRRFVVFSPPVVVVEKEPVGENGSETW